MEHPPSSLFMGKKSNGAQSTMENASSPSKKNPIIHFKMHRPLLMRFQTSDPMHNPHGDFDYDFESNDDDDDDDFVNCYNDGVREGIMMGGRDEDKGHEVCEAIIPGDEGIDHKADQFIAKFYMSK
ncbi:hypothetical protein Vadar_022381 [Vaccinium darrowii]|uniref:Uncharacterized protein n=1 Tax=Vaccinium darrowii TaxID=229202 RepID=A0ACB7XBJ2_9ERIC|nr:hypothetical protein Vadar_022381 [Vaccinium darrowii]